MSPAKIILKEISLPMDAKLIDDLDFCEDFPE